jgi:hypothetical protein
MNDSEHPQLKECHSSLTPFCRKSPFSPLPFISKTPEPRFNIFQTVFHLRYEWGDIQSNSTYSNPMDVPFIANVPL